MISMGKNAIVNNISGVCNTIAFFSFFFFFCEFYLAPSLK